MIHRPEGLAVVCDRWLIHALVGRQTLACCMHACLRDDDSVCCLYCRMNAEHSGSTMPRERVIQFTPANGQAPSVFGLDGVPPAKEHYMSRGRRAIRCVADPKPTKDTYLWCTLTNLHNAMLCFLSNHGHLLNLN